MIVRAENAMWSGTDTTTAQNGNDMFAFLAPPRTAVGLCLEFACTAAVAGAATGTRWGFVLADAAGNTLVDLGTQVAADALGVIFTGVPASGQGGRVEIGPGFTDKTAGGAALAFGYTSRDVVLPVQFKVQKFFAGGVATSNSWTWSVYPLYFHG